MTLAAVPSKNPIDFLLNVENLDKFSGSANDTFVDRLGGVNKTMAAYQREAAAAVNTLAAFNARGAFAATTAYALKDVYISAGIAYVAVIAHVSTSVAADLAAGKVTVHQGATKEDLAAPGGAALVTTVTSEAGAVPVTLETLARLGLHAVAHFGCDNTGATNTTAKLKAFFDACIASGKPGHIPAGTYLITAGVLSFDTPFVDAFWPSITTAGYRAVTFKRADAADAPMISLSNGVSPTGGAGQGAPGKYWLGGTLGGITFDQNGQATGANQHALRLRGVNGLKFGWMRANDQGGSAVCIESAMRQPSGSYNSAIPSLGLVAAGASNPDPYSVSFCEFEGVEANRCKRYALENLNFVGFTACRVKALRVINTEMGGMYGFGAGTVVDLASMGSVKGWAFDDGCFSVSTGGSPSRFTLGLAELDDVQNGIRLNKTTISDLRGVRFVHRFNANYLNTAEGYWPRKCVQINGGTGPATRNITLDVIHRIEAGGAKADMGQFADFANIAGADMQVDTYILDNAGFGFLDSELFTGLSVSSGNITVRRDGKTIGATPLDATVLACGDATTIMSNTGFGTVAAKLPMPVELSDRGGCYAVAEYTAPRRANYDVSLRFTLATGAIGTKLRIALLRVRSGAPSTASYKQAYSATVGAQSYELRAIVALEAGDVIYPMCDQNTAAPITCTPVISQQADNTFTVVALV